MFNLKLICAEYKFEKKIQNFFLGGGGFNYNEVIEDWKPPF